MYEWATWASRIFRNYGNKINGLAYLGQNSIIPIATIYNMVPAVGVNLLLAKKLTHAKK